MDYKEFHLIDGMETKFFRTWRKCRSFVIVFSVCIAHDMTLNTSGHTSLFREVSGVRPEQLVDVTRRDIGLNGTINGRLLILSRDTIITIFPQKAFGFSRELVTIPLN